jgi:hypothetical protein
MVRKKHIRCEKTMFDGTILYKCKLPKKFHPVSMDHVSNKVIITLRK